MARYRTSSLDLFLPTPSARRATRRIVPTVCHLGISTHALREEGDLSSSSATIAPIRFLPTPSARRATFHLRGQHRVLDISTHALREEGDDNTLLWHSPRMISTHALREEGDNFIYVTWYIS